MTTSAEDSGEHAGDAARAVDATGGMGVQVGDGTIQHNNYYIQEARFLQEPPVQYPAADDGLNTPVPDYARPPTAGALGASSQTGSPSTPLDQIQALVDARDAEDVQEQDRIIKALGEQVSAVTVARAMTVANRIGALPGGEVTLHASTDPMIDLTFSWQQHIGDGRFSEPSGKFLGVKAHVAADPGGLMPVIDTIWLTTETAETVIGRINAMLQQRDRWSGPKTINWEQIFRDLHQAIVLSVAYKRRDPAADWQLHGSLYELHGQDWAITEAGIEYRLCTQVVLSEADFPERTGFPGSNDPSGTAGWPPPPPTGVDPAQWKHILWRGQWHFPMYRGPARAHPVRWACKTFP